jgi:hypothetical protein
MPVRVARGPLRWYLRLTGFAGITLPPRGAYILQERMADTRLLRHEKAHWEQAQRLGAVRFYWRYLLLFVRHGYRNHPMEIEARQREVD